jgi:hypothetical protein
VETKEIDELVDITPLEKIKLKMELEKIKLEKNRIHGTFLSIVIPLILGVSTIFYGVFLENQKASQNFEIKAVEIVMNASSPKVATNKAIVLFELFPNRLPKNFKEKMLSLYGE